MRRLGVRVAYPSPGYFLIKELKVVLMAKKNKKRKQETKFCIGCNKPHVKSQFYVSYNKLHNGVYPYCKKFIRETVVEEDGGINLDKFKNILRQVDAPFLADYWKTATEGKSYAIGTYFRLLKLHQNKNLTWKDSRFDTEETEKQKAKDETVANIVNKAKKDALSIKKKKFKITPEIVSRWGENYDYNELLYLEKFYNDMHMTHTIVTPQHEKALIMISKLQLRMDKCLENDDMANFAKLHKEYQTLLTSSGLRPIDKVGGAEASGIKSFSQIFEEVEKEGFIKPAPIEENQDIVDRTIQYIMNYTLKLLDQQVLAEPPIDTPKVKGDK